MISFFAALNCVFYWHVTVVVVIFVLKSFFYMYCRKVTKSIKVVPGDQSRVSGYIIYERPELSIDLDQLIMSAVRDKFISSHFVTAPPRPSLEFVKVYECNFLFSLDVESFEFASYEGSVVGRTVSSIIYTTDSDCQDVFSNVVFEIKCENKTSCKALLDVRFLQEYPE